MTKDSDFKARVRNRMERTGERYTAARAALAATPPRDAAWQAAEREHQTIAARLIRGGTISALPARRKNMTVILLELLRQFEPGRAYPERQVNEILGAFHDDFAYLRRELVNYGYLTRSDGIYRVAPEPPQRAEFQAGEVSAWERLWLPEFMAGRAS